MQWSAEVSLLSITRQLTSLPCIGADGDSPDLVGGGAEGSLVGEEALLRGVHFVVRAGGVDGEERFAGLFGEALHDLVDGLAGDAGLGIPEVLGGGVAVLCSER